MLTAWPCVHAGRLRSAAGPECRLSFPRFRGILRHQRSSWLRNLRCAPATKVRSYSPSFMMTCIMPLIQATSVPGLGRRIVFGLSASGISPWIHHDQACPSPRHGPLHPIADHGMILGGVGAGNQNEVGFLDTVDGVGHCPAPNAAARPATVELVSETGAMIHIVGAHPPGKFLGHIVFFVGKAGGGQSHTGIRDRGRP